MLMSLETFCMMDMYGSMATGHTCYDVISLETRAMSLEVCSPWYITEDIVNVDTQYVIRDTTASETLPVSITDTQEQRNSC